MNLKNWQNIKEIKFYYYREDLEYMMMNLLEANTSILDSDEEFSAKCSRWRLNKELFMEYSCVDEILDSDAYHDLEWYLYEIRKCGDDEDEVNDFCKKALRLFDGITKDRERVEDIRTFIKCWALVSLYEEVTFYASTYEYPAILEVR